MSKETLKSKELRMALKIISGRYTAGNLIPWIDLIEGDDAVELLGYDIDQLCSSGVVPTNNEVKERAEKILFEYLIGLKG